MSRRESRVSMNVRQNDALFEFENFKKKFLLANKHITKLNSTLSVRIEELNAQISSLYVENLRLRASEIALAAQLKREREKSRKVMTEAETATLNLTKHLSYLRQSFNIGPSSPTPSTPPSPRARKPPATRHPANPSANSPQVPRLSKVPNVPGIGEEDEPLPSSSEHEDDKPPSPTLRKTGKSKPRLSASRLPLPARIQEPLPSLPLAVEPISSEFSPLRSSTRVRRPTRRQSGLLSIDDSLIVPRVPSPAFGSPIRRAAGLAEEAEEAAAVDEQLRLEVDMEVELEEEIHPKKLRRKSKGKERETGGEKEKDVDGVLLARQPLPRERERERERDKKREKGEDDDNGKGKPRLKDVTNSRAALLPIDNTVYDQPDEVVAAAHTRQFLGNSPPLSQPTSRSSSSPVPPSDGEGAGGRERRTRRSVNYAEPKLNTKMRKPDPPPGTAPPSTKKRSSAAASLPTYGPPLPDDDGNGPDNDAQGVRSSLGLPPLFLMNGNASDPSRFPLPLSRPTSTVGTNEAPVLFSPPTARTSVKRKKSRPQLVLDDDGEESEGVQADAEYGYGHSAGWVNVEGRRKGGAAGSGAKRSTNTGVGDETRRHSMAV